MPHLFASSRLSQRDEYDYCELCFRLPCLSGNEAQLQEENTLTVMLSQKWAVPFGAGLFQYIQPNLQSVIN